MSGGHGKKQKHEEHEEHENHERWLVSYADMMTLLMVLFLILFAMSKIDQTKALQLQEGFNQAFGTNAVLSGSSSILETQASSESSSIDMANGTGAAGEMTEADKKIAAAAVSAADLAKAQARMTAAEEEASNLTGAEKKIQAALAKEGLSGDASYTIDSRGLVVSIVTNSVVFSGDSAILRPTGQKILQAVGPTLKALPNDIEVDGHTNQLPVPTVNYPSAWELSTARASSVVRYLIANEGLASNRMEAAGFAGTRPLINPKDPRSVTLNRRVEIVVLSGLPDDTKALLATAAKTAGTKSTTTSTSTTSKTTTSGTTTSTTTKATTGTSATTASHSTGTD
jgi:chemotaxis protein MotB